MKNKTIKEYSEDKRKYQLTIIVKEQLKDPRPIHRQKFESTEKAYDFFAAFADALLPQERTWQELVGFIVNDKAQLLYALSRERSPYDDYKLQ